MAVAGAGGTPGGGSRMKIRDTLSNASMTALLIRTNFLEQEVVII